MDIRHLSLDEWGDALPSDGFEVFHTPEALSVLDTHTAGDLRLYAGLKGEQPVGLFPAFIQERTLGTAVLSPPPGFGIPRLGPLTMPNSPKRRKQEQVNSTFTEQVLDDLSVGETLTLFRTACPTSYPDPRPFVWSELDLDTRFTYHLDVDGSPDDMLKATSKSLRREIRDGRDLDVAIDVSETGGLKEIFEQTRNRYQDQARGLSLTWDYVRDLAHELSAVDRCRTYVVRDPSGEALTGIVVLYSNDAAYYWLGGTRTTYEGTSLNSLLHWQIVEDIAADNPRETVSTYDLMGANTQRLCRYKSKFGADLVPYYQLESSGPSMRAAKAAYQLVSR